jgi:hypothetical protein
MALMNYTLTLPCRSAVNWNLWELPFYIERGNKLRFCRMKFLTPSRKGAKEKPLNLCGLAAWR